MLEVFRQIKKYDTIFFVPNDESDDDNEVKVEIAQYKEQGEKIGGNELGDMYEIILFRMDEEYNIIDLDKFEGILIEPREYVSRMIKQDWYGMVSKKTTNSHKLVDDVFAKWSDLC
jgi:hypothetical protein